MPANQKKVTLNKFPLRLIPSVRRIAEAFLKKKASRSISSSMLTSWQSTCIRVLEAPQS
jgi:hypothetical protein